MPILKKPWLVLGVAGIVLGGCTVKEAPEKPGAAPRKVRPESVSKKDSCPLCCEVDRSQFVGTSLKRTAAGDWPLFGGTPQRNMVNTVDKDMPADWTVEGKPKNIKWQAQLGNKAYGGPVVAGGKVFVGTNNAFPRDPKIKGSRAVIMCFNEADGKFLWQAVHDIPSDEIFKEAIPQGMCSTPVVDGNRLYYVTPGCELICADTGTGKAVWRLDMMKELKVVPFHLGNCSPLVLGDLVFTVTSNGANDDKVTSPKAPSFIAVNKVDGKLAWQSNLPGEKIIEGQWSNPVVAVAAGKPQVIFPGGDNFLYAFEPRTGNLLWKFNCGINAPPSKDGKINNYPVATPVVHGAKLYLGLGLYPEHPTGTKFSNFLCVDLPNPGGEAKVAWVYGGFIQPRPEKGRAVRFGHTISTAAVHDGLVYVAEESGYLHCLDARTGKKYWEHDLLSSIWGSPYWVDGKVYLGTLDGDIFIFAHARDKKLIRQVSMEEAVSSTPVAANGVLFVATRSKLFAIARP